MSVCVCVCVCACVCVCDLYIKEFPNVLYHVRIEGNVRLACAEGARVFLLLKPKFEFPPKPRGIVVYFVQHTRHIHIHISLFIIYPLCVVRLEIISKI